MTQQTDGAALLSTPHRFLAAGGLILALAVVQEILKPDRDWTQIATTIASSLVGFSGGAYGRITAKGQIASRLPK